jgi:hypothetical protein
VSFHPPLEGEGRRASREARCETGWGELSLRGISPHPDRFRSRSSDRPSPIASRMFPTCAPKRGRSREHATSAGRVKKDARFKSQTATSHRRRGANAPDGRVRGDGAPGSAGPFLNVPHRRTSLRSLRKQHRDAAASRRTVLQRLFDAGPRFASRASQTLRSAGQPAPGRGP